jgi:hypothetical protein
MDEEPLLAPSLLVSVTAGQAARLWRQKRMRVLDDSVRIADVHYDDQCGLDIAGTFGDGI